MYSMHLYGAAWCTFVVSEQAKPKSTETIFWTEALPQLSRALGLIWRSSRRMMNFQVNQRGWGLNYHCNQQVRFLNSANEGQGHSNKAVGGILIHATGIKFYLCSCYCHNDGTSVLNQMSSSTLFYPKGMQTFAFDSMCVHFSGWKIINLRTMQWSSWEVC